MKKYEENDKVSKTEEEGPNMKTFSSQEGTERYNMIQNIKMSDMEKFKSFCQMLRLQKLYSKAKVYDYRPKDQLNVIELEKIKNYLEEEQKKGG